MGLQVGVAPLEGGVALLEDLEGGLEEGVAPRGGVTGGVVSFEPLKCGFLGGRSGGVSCCCACWPEEAVPVQLARRRHTMSADDLSRLSPMGVPTEGVEPLRADRLLLLRILL